MTKNSIITIVILLFFQILNAQTSKLDILLFELPDVVFTKIETAKDFKATYELQIKQPIDHSDPSKGYFYQRAFLSHKGFEQPTVMITEGYDRP
ncbi:MAG: hypothetical protein ACI87N_002509, partial [Flavobacteriales bacterium]